MRLGRALRRRFYYSVSEAGKRARWSKSEAYRRAATGELPTEIVDGQMMIRKSSWDRILRETVQNLERA
jgi:hypothetical protein